MEIVRSAKAWTLFLATLFIIATFEHCFATLKHYTEHQIYFGVDISTIKAIALVLAMDLGIFFSIKFIPEGKSVGISVGPAVAILALCTVISGGLNVHYMVSNTPAQHWFDLTVGVVVGLLIPAMLILFGWQRGLVQKAVPVLAGNLGPATSAPERESKKSRKIKNRRIRQRVEHEPDDQRPAKVEPTQNRSHAKPEADVPQGSRASGAPASKRVRKFLAADPDRFEWSNRRIADELGNVSHVTVGRVKQRLAREGKQIVVKGT